MEHSKNFAKVKNYFDSGFWSIDKVKLAVDKWITEAEYTEITGEEY